jgi:hypothetical protein
MLALIDIVIPLPEEPCIRLSCELVMAQADLDQTPFESELDKYPLELQKEFRRFSSMMFELSSRYGDTTIIRIFDPRSYQGLLKAIRYGIRRDPTFLVRGRKKIDRLDMKSLDQALQAAGAIVQKGSSGSAI